MRQNTALVTGLLALTTFGCDPDVSDFVDGSPVPPADAQPSADTLVPFDAVPPIVQMYVHTREQLFTMDDVAFDLTLVGDFGLDASEGGITDLAVTTDGSVYGISNTKLFTLSPATGLATFVAEVPGRTNVGLTFLTDGTLLATDQSGGVRQIDPVTGAVTEIGEFGGGYATAGDLVAVAGGTMYAISDEGPMGDENTNNVLLTVNTSTGVAAGVGQIGFGGVFGIAVANNRIYAFTRDGLVIEIDPTNGSGTLKRTYKEYSFWGAGVTPIAVIK